MNSHLLRFLVSLLLLAALLPGSPSSAGALAPSASDPAPLHRLTDPLPDPHAADVQYFPATGHTLRGAFLDYWTRYGGLTQFGYPLTEEFTEANDPDGKNPRLVQYFERNRFEYHPENAGTPYAVLLGPLGRDFHPADPPAAPQPASLYFAATGHNLSGPFRVYWEAHGGLFVHGYPISEPIQEQNQEDGQTYLVQYFERSRFEWHPENAGTAYEVLLGLLGKQQIQQLGYDAGTYPLYGYAADFSWIAGRMLMHVRPDCSRPDCGCAIFRYMTENERIQLAGNGWEAYQWSLRQAIRTGISMVVFGRNAKLGESYGKCAVDLDAPGFLVANVQYNQAP